jgi:hypothetical protein
VQLISRCSVPGVPSNVKTASQGAWASDKTLFGCQGTTTGYDRFTLRPSQMTSPLILELVGTEKIA